SIAKALSSIHSIHWNSQKEEVFVHGDFHPENILIENKKEEDVVIIDSPSSVKEDLKYRDLAMFMYHLNFKIPYKYKSLRAYLVAHEYLEYFMREYCRYFKEELDLKELNRYRIWTKKNHIRILKKTKMNWFLKRILIMHLKWRIFVVKSKSF
ncbi:MAG: aminoglycoside phosphotransferase family protein, partial [Nanoarchaeota archaeon]|nr:aminoglycoside phosphotransferase family protein [Nanoarchaeota archaeon]